ncbi:thioesterase family protein [Carnobacterium gallinarum]|uniref:thioesterase family protein n=1 Tax=Carnobacterium gallinarum TaxID=2749 RepID=UPI0005540341|nr:hotdog domain-containing protein [Carnobacterium gallinarum]
MSLKINKTIIVDSQQTAEAFKSGDIPVYASPALMAKSEELAKDLVIPLLKEGETTVGIEFSLNHIRPTEVGAQVDFEVRLVEQNKTILVYDFTVESKGQLIAEGTHKRAIINRQKFMEKLTKK